MSNAPSSALQVSKTSALLDSVKKNRGTQVAVVLAFFILIIGVVSVTSSSFQSADSFDRQRFGAPEPFLASPSLPAPSPVMEITRSESSSGAVLTQTRIEIFTASILIEKEDVKAGVDQVTIIAQQANGFVSDTDSSSRGDRDRASITIRVPNDAFASTIAAIELLGNVRETGTSSDDITEEFIDLTIRRDNLLKQEERFLEILDVADTVSDILEIERELGRVRSDIERLTGRINFLDNLAAFSTITTRFVQPATTPLPSYNIGEIFRNGLSLLLNSFRIIVDIFFALIPFVIVGGPIYYVYKKRKERRARAKEPAKKDSSS